MPTMRVDEYGFWKVKDYAFQNSEVEPYLLPAHATQVRECLTLWEPKVMS
jgi:hypothetical protein